MQSGTAINGLAAAINTAIDPQIWTAFALAGEKAILSLQASPAINGLAAGINALFDFGAGEEFGASFTKYMQAGKDANQDLIDDINAKLSDLPTTAETFAKFMEAGTESAIENIDEIQAKIDAINRKAKEQTIMQRDAAAAINAEEKAAQEKAMAESLAGSAGASSLANDYARRGLSLDASGSGNLANRTNKAVESILSLLIKNFRVTREPVF
jgi:phage gpG-like protein